MTDLPAALLALLREVRRDTEHTDSVCEHVTDGAIKCDTCYCDWQERFEAEVSRRWVASIDAAIKETDSFCPWWATHGGLTPERAAECLAKVHDATLQAARAARSAPEVKP